jgi:hypothetical protein
VRGQHEDTDLRALAPQLQRRVQALGRVRRRHADVQHDHLGLQVAYEHPQLGDIAGLPGDLEAMPVEQGGEPFPQQHVVLGQHEPRPLRGVRRGSHAGNRQPR